MIQDIIVAVFVIGILGYVAVLVYVLIAMRVKRQVMAEAVESRRMIDSNRKVYYVIPWPEADEASWAKRMKYLEQHPLENDFAYLTEWQEYKDKHDSVAEEAQ